MPNTVNSAYDFTGQIHKNSTQFCPETLSSTTGKLVSLNKCKTFCNFSHLIEVGGLIERGAYLKVLLEGRGLLERGLIERGLNRGGLNRAFAVFSFIVDLKSAFLFLVNVN